jgi:hypothetical protein
MNKFKFMLWFEKIKLFLKKNGFTSILFLGLMVGFFFFGMPKLAFAAGGVFFGRNWEICVAVYKEKLAPIVKEKLDDIIK